MHKLAINSHFLAVRTQVIAVVALLSVLFSAHLQLRAVGTSTCRAKQVGRLPNRAHHLFVWLNAVVRTIVFHSHLKVCCQHSHVSNASSATTHVDSARGMKRSKHSILLSGSGLLFNLALVEWIVVTSAILATLHVGYGWVTDTHRILTTCYRV
jgi:hypothetical protein